MQENRLALCVNDKCRQKNQCLRYRLVGNENDTWIDFKAKRINGYLFCFYFRYVYSKESKQYITETYRYQKGGKLNGE